MTARTMYLTGVRGLKRVAPEEILTTRHDVEMGRIHTGADTTEVVNLKSGGNLAAVKLV